MRQPPTGTVTFLFTDIEGSTQLWERSPAAMRLALARHDSLLRDAIEHNGGFVFKTVGDAFCAAFTTATEAVAGALAAQRLLFAEPWPTETLLRVRMALHTGSAEERDGDYFGPALNRVARLMVAGHGGQTLLSLATLELVRDQLPDGAALRDLGEASLRDLARPERIFALLHSDLPADFPPLRSLDNPALPNNLPQQATSFIGREKEAAEVKAFLGRTRLLTLTGAGGSGKTRLSLQVAADLLDGVGDGVWLVELAALSDPALVPQAVADALGVREEADRPIRKTLVEWLTPKRLLLILDNCEHVVAACAALAADLLRSCPQVHILASSREALNVAGEQVYRVPSLSLPDPKGEQTVAALSQCEAVRLFIDRAQSIQPSFTVTRANAPAVAQVCCHLDGIPLALELAAARVRSLSVEEVNTRLDDRFRLLTGGSRTALPRQQTLRALIDWSYSLLAEGEKTLLRRLSVFAGGWTLAAAEAVCAGEGIEDSEVLDLLTGLVDKSLVVYEEAGDGGRSRLLETIRQYAGDRLQEGGEAVVVQGRAASWFLALAEEAEPQLRGPEQAAWLSRLEAEHSNLRASLSWYEQAPGHAQRPGGAQGPEAADGAVSGLRLAGALWRFWFVRGYYSEGQQWLGRALERTRGVDGTASGGAAAARSKALRGAGVLAASCGDYAEARGLLGESLSIARQIGDQRSIVSVLGNLGVFAERQGDYVSARALQEESLSIARQTGDQQGIAYALVNLAFVAEGQGDYAAARTLCAESLSIARRLGDQNGIASSLVNLASVAYRQGDYAAAQTLYEESLTIRRQIGDQQGIADALGSLGQVASEQGDHVSARALYEESLTIHRSLGGKRGVAHALILLAFVAQGQGDYTAARGLYGESLTSLQQLDDLRGVTECLAAMAGLSQTQGGLSRAARLWGASVALRESASGPLAPTKQAEMDQTAAAVRAALGEDAFSAAWDAGRAMTLEQAVEYALSGE